MFGSAAYGRSRFSGGAVSFKIRAGAACGELPVIS
jgi:hypothetical protein